MRKTGRNTWQALGAGLFAAALLGASLFSGEALAVKVRIAYLPIADAVSYFVAKDRGFFKKEGLEVEANIIGGGVVQIPAMEGGSIDIGWSGVVAVIRAHTKGFDMQFFAPGHALEQQPSNVGALWMTRANNANISSIKDLVGKKVAINKLGGISNLGVYVVLDHAGVPYKSVRVVEVPFPQMTPAIVQGRVDAAIQVEPFASIMRMKKTGKVLARGTMSDIAGPRWQVSGWITKKSWIAKNQQTARAFVRAITGAVNYLHRHPDEAPAIIAANTRMKADLVKRIVRSAHPAAFRLADLQVVIDMAAKMKMIDKPFAAREIIADIAPVE